MPRSLWASFGAHALNPDGFVSIQTAAENVAIWTPVAQQVDVPVEDVEIEW